MYPSHLPLQGEDFIDITDTDEVLDIPQFALFNDEPEVLEIPPPKQVPNTPRDTALSLLRSKVCSFQFLILKALNIPSTPVRRLTTATKENESLLLGCSPIPSTPKRKALFDISILDKWLDDEETNDKKTTSKKITVHSEILDKQIEE